MAPVVLTTWQCLMIPGLPPVPPVCRVEMVTIISLGFFSFIELQTVLGDFHWAEDIGDFRCWKMEDTCRGSGEPWRTRGLVSVCPNMRGPGTGVLLVGLEQVAHFPR